LCNACDCSPARAESRCPRILGRREGAATTSRGDAAGPRRGRSVGKTISRLRLVGVLLLWRGSIYLAHTIEIGELILNAVAFCAVTEPPSAEKVMHLDV